MNNSNDSTKFDTSEFSALVKQRTARLKDADDITIRGYVQLPWVVLYSRALTDGDKITHLLLLSFSWQETKCFPKQESLGTMRGRPVRQMRRNLRNLANNGIIFHYPMTQSFDPIRKSGCARATRQSMMTLNFH